MNPWLVEIGPGALVVVAWFGLYGLILLNTRARGVDPAPPTPDLGPEPPALASLVASGWDLTEDAAEATLLDLGARKLIEFRQAGADPMHTTIHLSRTSPAGLSKYEKRVFDRVSGLAVSGVVPLTALTFRDRKKARTWWKHLRAEIVADARSRGLSRPRFGKSTITALVGAAALAGIGVAVGVLLHEIRTGAADPTDAPWAAGFFTFLLLSGLAIRPAGERDTPAGREAATRWLGVRDWLRAHEAFADLPPSAVAVWDRYLSYGAALGTTRLASAVVDMGMGNRKRVWSSFGSGWHRVRVRYPRWGSRYGANPLKIFVPRLIAVFFGYLLVRWWRPVIAELAAVEQLQDSTLAQRSGLIQAAGLLLGLVLVAYGIYGVVRMIIDLLAPLTVTGQVLWIEVWRVEPGGENSPARPALYYLAIDDGTSDQTTAWAMPADLYGGCDTGDKVTITARRWTRRITTVSVTERGTAGHRDGSQVATPPPEKLVASLLGAGAGAAAGLGLGESLALPSAASLLTADEVGAALGQPVAIVDTPLSGPMRLAQYATVDSGQAVLLLQFAVGPMGRMAWQGGRRGTDLPGVGDAAFAAHDRAGARCGDATLLLTLVGDSRTLGGSLPALLRQAVARMPVSAVG